MVSLALYRGNLHRVSDAPRQWQMPPRAITLSQFRILTQRREKALARLAAAQKNPKKEEEEVEEVKVKEEEEEEAEVKNPEVPQPQSIEVKVESKEAEDRKTIEASIPASSAAKGSETATTTQVINFVTFSNFGIRAIYNATCQFLLGGSERLGLIIGMFGKFYYFKAILHFMLDRSWGIRAWTILGWNWLVSMW